MRGQRLKVCAPVITHDASLGGQECPQDHVGHESGDAAGEQQQEPEAAYQPDGQAKALRHTAGHAGDHSMSTRSVKSAGCCHRALLAV